MFNYNNPYLNNYGGNYYQQPYNNAPTQNYQPQQNNYNTTQQTPSNGVVNQQPTYMPLTFVNGIEGVNKHIVAPNMSIYLRDNDSNKLFIKSCDSTGKYLVKTYELVEVNPDKPQKATEPVNIDTNNFILKEDLKVLEDKFEARFNKLQSRLDKMTAKKEEK